MLNTELKIRTGIVLVVSIIGLTGCSVLNKVGKTARNLTTFGGSSVTDVDNTLIVPPTLKIPVSNTTAAAQSTASRSQAQTTQKRKAIYRPDGNYYIIVGTYPDQIDALDTFTRLSSIGLKGATMESRRTKGGKILHMVRLGPYNSQEDIDQAKDSLTNTGMSQFKIVKN